MTSKYDVGAIRQKLKQSMSGKFSDPDEFKPDKAKSVSEAIKYRFFILPPLFKGDVLKSGTVEKSMDQFFLAHANHWINDKPYPCPRVWENNECEICQFGFDLLKEEENRQDEDKRRKVIKEWMPTSYNMVNILFTQWKGNPEELRGKVKFYNASKTLFDQWTATLMRDNAGDPEDPQAYGVFFDENAGFVYELQVLKQGKQNSYKTSHFLSNGGIGMPMIKNKDGNSPPELLEKLLKLRHNLWDKIEVPDLVKNKKIFNAMTHGDDGDDSDGGFDEDETKTETKTEKPKSEKPKSEKPKSEKPKSEKPKSEKPKPKPDDDDDEDVVTHLSASSDDDDDDAVPDLDSLDNESPLIDVDDVKESSKESKKSKESPKESPKESSKDDSDVSSDEIDDLLSQLDDDDD
tara:strand:- start:584 stop:1798 length:1215 start_codon:yes stop_codon:yes gene_type:complete